MLGAQPMAKVEYGTEEGGEEPPGANQREEVAQRHLGLPSLKLTTCHPLSRNVHLASRLKAPSLKLTSRHHVEANAV